MSQSPRKIAIKGGYGYGNFGDDTLMIAVFEIAKQVFGTTSIVFFCSDANYVKKLIPGAKVISPTARCGDVDIVVYGGGTQFYSFPLTHQKNLRSPLKRIVYNMKRLISLGKRMAWKVMNAFSSNPRLVAIGMGLGPFVENCSHMHKTKKLFKQMEYVATRDIYSYDLCKKWECNNVLLRSDLCYFPGLWKPHIPDSGGHSTDIIGRVGIIVRDWPHNNEGNSYVAPLFQVVNELRSAGKETDFISFARKSDNEWIKCLKDKGEQLKAWDPEKCTISEFMSLLSSYDAFVTARYHGAVFASILGKPVVCVEVEQKLRLVSDLLGRGSRLWTYPFIASECVSHIFDFEEDYSSSVECLARVVKEQGILAEKMAAEFHQIIVEASKTTLRKDMRP